MASEGPIAAIRLLMETEGITITDLESEGVVGGETVAGFFDQALAAMTDSTRDRYEPYLQILRDGLDETCWCLCEKCCGYVNSVCRCYDGCGCDTDKRIPVLEVATGGTVTKGIDRGGGCRARLVGMGTVPLAAVTTGHLIVVQSWVRQRGKKRWIAANARRADQGRPQHVRDGRSAKRTTSAPPAASSGLPSPTDTSGPVPPPTSTSRNESAPRTGP